MRVEPTRAVHVELLATVFATVVPAWIMSVLFAGVGAIAVAATGDPLVRLCYAAGLATTVARMAAMLRFRRRFRTGLPDHGEVVAIERRFAATYLAFAVALGAFGGCAYPVVPDRVATLIVVLIVGYCAGVSAGVGLRPRIGVASMAIAVAPVGIAACLDGGEGLMLALSLAGFLGGGIRSTLVRYRATVENIDMRHMFATLARTDPLTGLPNRLALAEHLAAAARSGTVVSLHYLDLDGFKLVNDRFGHPAGDAVLAEVAARLRRLLPADGLAVRVGGDEFILVQPAARGDAAAFAMRVEFAMAEPYAVGATPVPVGIAMGSIEIAPGDDVAEAIARADAMLYAAKEDRLPGRRGVAA